MESPLKTAPNSKFVTSWVSKACAKLKEQSNVISNKWKKIGCMGLVMTLMPGNQDFLVNNPLLKTMGQNTDKSKSDGQVSRGGHKIFEKPWCIFSAER